MQSFTRLTAAEYLTTNTHRIAEINAPYVALVQALGEPHKSTDADYPDDSYKTDVCWAVRSPNGATVTIWNYKNGPAYNNGEGSVDEIDSFSAHYTDRAFFAEIETRINAVSLTLAAELAYSALDRFMDTYPDEPPQFIKDAWEALYTALGKQDMPFAADDLPF